MEIDDILEILFDGTKEEIDKNTTYIEQIKKNLDYEFYMTNDKCNADDLEAYTIKNNSTLEVVRGSKCHYTPNCVKYFGKEYIYEI